MLTCPSCPCGHLQVLPAIPTQIEEPPSEEDTPDEDEANVEESEEVEEESGWDVDYKVNRPTSAPDSEEEESGCDRNYVEEEEGDKDCTVAGKDLTPYRKYKSYAKWQRRPLFVIIIGG